VVKAEAYGIEDTFSISTVAVKMLKERADMSQRKTLLAELKILIHVGRHMNIVNLLGAVTKDLIKGELMVIVEYCRLGNIRSFLLAHRRTFVNQLNKEIDGIDSTITEREERYDKYFNHSSTDDNNQSEYQNISFMEGLHSFKVIESK
jgi:serine/threonine protein kinase